ncbi:MAG: hypothetical protein LBN25_01245 [Christensenellaceae bacterium]|jgi:hypothetical protein|nr:hypothetical protein [Christensenellaceae bacterium]
MAIYKGTDYIYTLPKESGYFTPSYHVEVRRSGVFLADKTKKATSAKKKERLVNRDIFVKSLGSIRESLNQTYAAGISFGGVKFYNDGVEYDLSVRVGGKSLATQFINSVNTTFTQNSTVSDFAKKAKVSTQTVTSAGIPLEYNNVDAYNSAKPHFFTAVLRSVRGLTLFPNDAARNYFVYELLFGKNAESDKVPVSVEAYALADASIYFIFSTFDATKNSIFTRLRGFSELYARYYNSAFRSNNQNLELNPVNDVFRDRFVIKEISAKDIFLRMSYVHDKPVSDGLSGYYDYDEFSSYESLNGIADGILRPQSQEAQDAAIAQYQGFSEAIRRSYPTPQAWANGFYSKGRERNKWWNAKNDKVFGERWYTNHRYDYFKFNRQLEEALIGLGVNPEYNAIELQGDTIRDLVISLNRNAGFTWEYICKRLLQKGKGKEFDRSALLASVITKLVIETENTYDNTLYGFGLSSQTLGMDILLEVFWRINMDKGWSFEYISRLMGFQFPDTTLIASLIRALQAKNPETTTAHALALLSVTDEPGLPLAWEAISKLNPQS